MSPQNKAEIIPFQILPAPGITMNPKSTTSPSAFFAISVVFFALKKDGTSLSLQPPNKGIATYHPKIKLK